MFANEQLMKAETSYRIGRARQGLADVRRRRAAARASRWQGPLRGADEMR